MDSWSESHHALTNANQSLQDSRQNTIKVAARIRPRTKEEIHSQTPVLVRLEDSQSINVTIPSNYGRSVSRRMQFDYCLGESAGEEDIMDSLGIPQLLDAVLAGYHVCILAYGPTGSGKTHTISGIIQNAVEHLLNSTQEKTLHASYLEVYNEAVFDLLSSQTDSKSVRWDREKGFYVSELKTVRCPDRQTSQLVIEHGNKSRKVGSNPWNERSSRSHTLFTLQCSATYREGRSICGKITFVDLAGSERLRDVHSTASSTETAKINKSLFCLGKVIVALVQKKENPGIHIPYRDSILTKLLMDSLGGNCLTLLITCCSPCGRHVEETLNALNYSQKAMNVVNSAPIQDKAPDRPHQMEQLKTQIHRLLEENSMLKAQLRAKEEPDVWRTAMNSNEERRGDQILEEIQGLRNKLKNLESRFSHDAELNYEPRPSFQESIGTMQYAYRYPVYPQINYRSPVVDAECYTEVFGYPLSDCTSQDAATRLKRFPPDQCYQSTNLLGLDKPRNLPSYLGKDRRDGVIIAKEDCLKFLSQ